MRTTGKRRFQMGGETGKHAAAAGRTFGKGTGVND